MKEAAVYYDRGEPGYPGRLLPYSGMPRRLYVKGRLPEEDRPTVAIVGARMCSPYGRAQALRYAASLASMGVQIISGLAYGVDAYAHQGALDGGGRTFAVLGCGVNICYPRENYPLLRRMLEKGGGVLSEFEPKDAPLPWHFPARNRIISALADAVLVIEAKVDSGSLITAEYALEQGKTIFALPGRVSDDLSEGCNRLIADGAGIAWSPECIAQELGVCPEHSGKTHPSAGESPAGSGAEQRVLEALRRENKSLSALADETGLEPRELSAALVALCLAGRAEEKPPGFYALSAKS